MCELAVCCPEPGCGGPLRQEAAGPPVRVSDWQSRGVQGAAGCRPLTLFALWLFARRWHVVEHLLAAYGAQGAAGLTRNALTAATPLGSPPLSVGRSSPIHTRRRAGEADRTVHPITRMHAS
jgi:hypothetical protein